MNDYFKNLPKKRMGSGSLFFNDKGELLIVKPTYKEGWTIPGGSVDQNESPLAACIREVKEEIGLDKIEQSFLCVDYRPDNGDGDCLQFLFYGGILNATAISNIKLQAEELGEFKFVKIDEALTLLSRGLQKRLPKCLEALKNNTAIYLENEY